MNERREIPEEAPHGCPVFLTSWAITNPLLAQMRAIFGGLGRFMVPIMTPDQKSDFDIGESPDGHMLAITEGEGANREWQQFRIVKYEVLSDTEVQ